VQKYEKKVMRGGRKYKGRRGERAKGRKGEAIIVAEFANNIAELTAQRSNTYYFILQFYHVQLS